jgi:hypothetical protein
MHDERDRGGIVHPAGDYRTLATAWNRSWSVRTCGVRERLAMTASAAALAADMVVQYGVP